MNFEPLIFTICACALVAVFCPRFWKIAAAVAGLYCLAWFAAAFCVLFL